MAPAELHRIYPENHPFQWDSNKVNHSGEDNGWEQRRGSHKIPPHSFAFPTFPIQPALCVWLLFAPFQGLPWASLYAGGASLLEEENPQKSNQTAVSRNIATVQAPILSSFDPHKMTAWVLQI